MATALKTLLIEDYEDDALLLVRELRTAGYDVSYERVDTAAGIEAALRREEWDIVISDYQMPSFTGSDALRIVRQHSPDLPFIFVSGSIGEDTAVAAMRAGAQDYVMKGNIRRLAPAIARELREAEGRRRKRIAEEQLRATSELLRSVFSASPLAIIAADANGKVKLWNPAAERMFGWQESEVMGARDPSALDQERAAREAHLARAGAGETFTTLDARRQRKDGSFVDVSVSIAATFDRNQTVEGLTVVVQDLTERKLLEAQFLQAQKMEAVGRLAGGVAHDFNNILTVISSYSDLLFQTLPADDDRRDDVGEIMKAAQGATALTRQLLAFSRKQVVQRRVVELNSVVTDATSLLRRLIGERITLHVSLDPDAGRVSVDPGQIEQIIMNLVVNARDAMPDGGELTIETSRGIGGGRDSADDASWLSAGQPPAGRQVALSVTDTGSGMDEATQTRMFEPFFTTKPVDKGTGLGLSTVYGIVKQYEGAIRVRSAPGAGTTFQILLPRAEIAPGTPRDVAAVPVGRRPTETVLLVEDESAVRRVARRVLEKAGYRVLEAADGDSALSTAATYAGEIQLLLTDVVMPGIGGRELAERLLADRPETKVMFASGYAGDADELSALLTSRHAYVMKPFSPDALLRAVRDALDQVDSRDTAPL